MPGLTDAHVHVCAVEAISPSSTATTRRASSAAKAPAPHRAGARCRGFTDRARRGRRRLRLPRGRQHRLFRARACLVSGRALSQTGGHADKRRRSSGSSRWSCCVGSMVGVMRRRPGRGAGGAAREQIRHDVDQIKIMASGGAMSPGDELDTTQYTVDEMRAAVEEARAVGRYVLAHAYSPSAVRATPSQAGVRSHRARQPARHARRQGDQEGWAPSSCRPWSPTRPSGARARATAIADHQIQEINMARERSVEGI